MTAAHSSLKQTLTLTAFCLFLGVVSVVRVVNQVKAQAGESENITDQIMLTAIPPRLGDNQELKAKPGEKIQTVIRVRNSSDEALAITTQAQDFIIGEDGETPIPVTDATSNRWSLASWITLAPGVQVVQPGQTANVSVLITVPDDALPGGHYAMLMHEPSHNLDLANGNAPAKTGSESRIAQRVGTLVYFLVDGPINEEAFIRGFEFKNLSEYGPVPFNFSVENMSDVHIKPRISVEVFNIFGKRVDTLSVEEKNVFPLMSRNFSGQWDRIWGIGLYTAQITMNFGSTGQIVMAKDQFWLIPYKLVLAGIVIILAIIGVLTATRRHMIHRRGTETSRIQELEQKVQELEGPKTTKFDE